MIRNTSPITILEDLQEQGVSINDYIQDTKTTFEELMTYQKKKMNDNSGDFIKNGRLENALNAAQKSRKITEVSKLTNSLYVNEFAKPIEHVQ